jgi:hypothetical protein
MPEDSSTLRAAMDRILGAAPGYSAQQTVGQDVRQGGGLSGPSAATSAEDTVQVPTKTPFSNVSSNITHEGGIYDPDARRRALEKEQLTFQNYALEESNRRAQAQLAEQKAFSEQMAALDAQNAQSRQQAMVDQQAMMDMMNQMNRPPPQQQQPRYNYTPPPAVAPVSSYTAPNNVNPSQPNTQQIYGAQPRQSQQIYPGTQPSHLGTQQIYPGR